MRSTRRLGGLSRSANQSHPAAQAPGSEETPAPPGAAEARHERGEITDDELENLEDELLRRLGGW